MLNGRAFFVWITVCAAILIGMSVKARAYAAEPLDVPCSFVRTAVRAAGGTDNAIREALRRGYSADQIVAVIRKCRLK